MKIKRRQIISVKKIFINLIKFGRLFKGGIFSIDISYERKHSIASTCKIMHKTKLIGQYITFGQK